MPVLVVTDRKLCRDDFLGRIERIAAAKPAGILLRERDMPADAYMPLARACADICTRFGVDFIVHTHIGAARHLGVHTLHLRLADLRVLGEAPDDFFVETSVHTVSEAHDAAALGAGRLIAGHIFATDCKAGTPGRGIDFLDAVCRSVSVPVYAIGGITPDKLKDIRRTSAAGVCIMSSAMQSDDPAIPIAAMT